MKRLEVFSNDKTYMYPNGDIAPAERIVKDFPAVTVFTHVIETDDSGEVCYAVQSLNALKAHYGIPKETPDDEAIATLEAIINEPQPEMPPSAEERIAAALEFQNLLSM